MSKLLARDNKHQANSKLYWQHGHDANGALVEWLMNGTSFAASPSVIGSATQDYAIAAHQFDLV